MKAIVFTLFLTAISGFSFGQLPYTWTAGVNPGWIATAGTGSTLQWQGGCGFVTTNCTGNYLNNSSSIFTSPVMDATCSNASTANVSFTAFGSAEYGFDFLFIEYSLNSGGTWINPYGVGIAWTGNFGAAPGFTIPAITIPTSSTMQFRFRFTSDPSVRDIGLKITDFDVVCNVVLPVELASFTGTRMGSENVLAWSTLSEKKCDRFEIEYTTDQVFGNWTQLTSVPSKGDSESRQDYAAVHKNPVGNKLYYYRLKQVDTDGNRTDFEQMVVVDTSLDGKSIVKRVDVLGNVVNESYSGMVLLVYEDGTILKTMQ